MMEFTNKPITILLATYNGDRFIDEQIRSIQQQSFTNWELIIRDDNSTDNTLSIINNYLTDNRIKLINSGRLHGSACINFSALFDWALINSTGYIMFADQDDIWMPHKIQQSLIEIQKLEALHIDIPIMCYSKFQLMSSKGQAINKEIKLPNKLNFNTQLIENYAWGCTMIINQQLAKRMKKIPVNAVNHDYWVALVATGFGITKLINQPLLYYRQHDNNVSGTIENSSWGNRIKRYFGQIDVMIKPLYMNFVTVCLFYESYLEVLDSKKLNILVKFMSAFRTGTTKLLYTMFKYNIVKIGLGKNLAMVYSLIALRPKVYVMLNNKERKTEK